MKFITKQIHAFLDYPVAIALMALPFVLNLGTQNPLALYLSVATGIAAFILTIFTDHQLGIFKVISYRWHLIVDMAVGLLFIAIPFIFSFQGMDAYFYWINGIAVLAVVNLDKVKLIF